MRKYFALVEHEKEGAVGVRFPDLPGVFSAADQRADVIVNAIEALRLWAEDEALPGPSDHDAVVARDDIREAPAAGACLVEVPHP